MIDATDLPKLLRCDFQTGKLYWLVRTLDTPGCAAWTSRTLNGWNARYAGKEAFYTLSNTGYRQGYIHDRMYHAHRVVFALAHGRWPEGNIDHIDHDGLNNAPSNLREVSQADNMRNQRLYSNNATGVCGVHLDKRSGKFCAEIGSKDNRERLGRFFTLEEAAAARREAEKRKGFHENHGKLTVPGAVAAVAL